MGVLGRNDLSPCQEPPAACDPTGMEIEESLTRAFGRIADFQAVQRDASADELADAVALLQESVGISDVQRGAVREGIERIAGAERATGHVLLGVIVGLMAGEEA